MKLIAIVIAVFCGVTLCIELDTGTLSAMQVAGLGIIAAAAASVVP
mgnify:CR=1 FL=1